MTKIKKVSAGILPADIFFAERYIKSSLLYSGIKFRKKYYQNRLHTAYLCGRIMKAGINSHIIHSIIHKGGIF